ncbi:MAG: radical SAM family heme chaperone HemW [Chlamydiota bacterium]|nr:radical SAM family heme chaperone HemW [Chlamydiota bacterium]
MVIGLSPKNQLSLYFHIPFCKKKCDYCHFYVVPDKEEFKQLLLTGLQQEWLHWANKIETYDLTSIYFGGGTPSLFGPQRISQIIQWVQEIFPFKNSPPEITLEANPENITIEMMRAYKDAGINRVSIGVQSLNNSELIVLSRQHNAHAAIQAIIDTHAAGIDNISIDLMYDLPSQTAASWHNTLNQIQKLPITHLSLYNLTIEPHTVFHKFKEKLTPSIPCEDMSLDMYKTAIASLHDIGLVQYEISAFAKNGLHSLHNTGYWTGRSFIGLGPSAYSFWKGERFKNISNIHKYAKLLSEGDSPVDYYDELSIDDRRKELFIVALRLLNGCNYNEFKTRYGCLDQESNTTLNRLVRNGLITCKNDCHYALSEQGLLLYDYIASELI